MENDIEDIKKLDIVIKEEHDQNILTDEFDDFINQTITDDEEQLEELDVEELTDIEDAIDNIVDSNDGNIYHNVDTLNFSADLNLVKHFLDLEEIKVVNSCKDAQLKRLLILNRAKHVQLQSIRYKLYELLKDCKLSLKAVEEKIMIFNKQEVRSAKGIIPRLGHPYFKTRDFYSCNLNEDTIRKQNDKELCMDYLKKLSRWTLEDQVTLKRAIIFDYTTQQVDKYEAKLKALASDKKRNREDEGAVALIETNILDVQKLLEKLKNNDNPEPPPLNCEQGINWGNIAKCDLHNRHSAEACKAFWNIYLHPSINKSAWSKEENKRIQQLCKTYNSQNWEQIALELNNNRSGFAVCVHYYSTFSDKFKKDRFSQEEDQFLIDVVNFCRIGNYIPWSKVCHFFEDRSRTQLYHRYKYNLEFSNLKKGGFSKAEDVLIAILVNKYGKDFSRCCKHIPNRSPIQIAHRYNNYVRFDRMYLGCWSLEEDTLLMEHVTKNGPKDWSKLFSVLKSKNRSHIRQRYVQLKNWLSKNQGKHLIDIPRKGRLYSKGLELVKKCAEHFNNDVEIPSVDAINEQLTKMGHRAHGFHQHYIRPLQSRVRNDNIDKELIEYFQSTCKIRTSKEVLEPELNHIVEIVKILLAALNVELTVPDQYSLHNNLKIDALDIEILSTLFKDVYMKDEITIDLTSNKSLPSSSSSRLSAVVHTPYPDNSQSNIVEFNSRIKLSTMPPNINTLVAMRSMLIIYQSHKSKNSVNKHIYKLSDPLRPKITELDSETQVLILSDQEKYMKRFNVIFQWPALMSIMEPNQNLNFTQPPPKPNLSISKEQKVGRPKKNVTKIELMNKARMNNYLNRKSLDKQFLNQETNINKDKSLEVQTNISEVADDSADMSKVKRINKESVVSTTDSADVSKVKRINKESVVSTIEQSNKTKRDTSHQISEQALKRVKIDNGSSETTNICEDIDKLNSVLKLELNTE